jgi:phage tail sheath protein FI
MKFLKCKVSTGLYALEKVELFNLVCFLPSRGNEITVPAFNKICKYCEHRRAMFVMDPPSSWQDVGEVTKSYPIPGLTPSPNAAIYFPNLKVPNPLRGSQTETIKPSGAIAGIYARTDASFGVWKAPAGTGATLNAVSGLSLSVDDTENDELNALGINCLRSFPKLRLLVWGARTMVGGDQSTSQWKYVPVRRLALFLEGSIERGTQWAVFVPNDEPLWTQLSLNIEAFMIGLWCKGAFQGTTPKTALFVKCDHETMTQDDIQKGLVNIIVGFAPLKPAEFVILKFQQRSKV